MRINILVSSRYSYHWYCSINAFRNVCATKLLDHTKTHPQILPFRSRILIRTFPCFTHGTKFEVKLRLLVVPLSHHHQAHKYQSNQNPHRAHNLHLYEQRQKQIIGPHRQPSRPGRKKNKRRLHRARIIIEEARKPARNLRGILAFDLPSGERDCDALWLSFPFFLLRCPRGRGPGLGPNLYRYPGPRSSTGLIEAVER